MSEDNNSGNSHQIDLSEQGKTRQISMIATGKSLSEALFFAEHVVYKNCSECQ